MQRLIPDAAGAAAALSLAALVFAAARTLPSLAEAPALISHPLDLAYPETAVARGVSRLLDGGPWAYGDPLAPPFACFPYGPLTYLAPAELAWALGGGPGSARFAGRLLGWGSLAGAAALLGLFAAGSAPRGKPWLRAGLGLFAAAAFLDSVVRLSARNLLSCRGDAPALLLLLASALAIRRACQAEGKARTRFALAGLFCGALAAGFHQLAAAGLAAGSASLWAVGDRRRALLFLGGAGALACAGLAFGRALFGPFFWGHVFGAMGACPWTGGFARRFLLRAPSVLGLCALALGALWARRREPADRAALAWLAVVLALQGAALAKAGASFNYLVPGAAAALAFGARLCGETLSEKGRWRWFPVAFALVAGWLPHLPKGRLAETGAWPRAETLRLEAEAARVMAERLERGPFAGNFATDDAALLAFMGREPVLADPYWSALMMDAGASDPALHPLVDNGGAEFLVVRWLASPGGKRLENARHPFAPRAVADWIEREAKLVETAPPWLIYRAGPNP